MLIEVFNEEFVFLLNVIVQKHWQFVNFNRKIFLEKWSRPCFTDLQLNYSWVKFGYFVLVQLWKFNLRKVPRQPWDPLSFAETAIHDFGQFRYLYDCFCFFCKQTVIFGQVSQKLFWLLDAHVDVIDVNDHIVSDDFVFYWNFIIQDFC